MSQQWVSEPLKTRKHLRIVLNFSNILTFSLQILTDFWLNAAAWIFLWLKLIHVENVLQDKHSLLLNYLSEESVEIIILIHSSLPLTTGYNQVATQKKIFRKALNVTESQMVRIRPPAGSDVPAPVWRGCPTFPVNQVTSSHLFTKFFFFSAEAWAVSDQHATFKDTIVSRSLSFLVPYFALSQVMWVCHCPAPFRAESMNWRWRLEMFDIWPPTVFSILLTFH